MGFEGHDVMSVAQNALGIFTDRKNVLTKIHTFFFGERLGNLESNSKSSFICCYFFVFFVFLFAFVFPFISRFDSFYGNSTVSLITVFCSKFLFIVNYCSQCCVGGFASLFFLLEVCKFNIFRSKR